MKMTNAEAIQTLRLMRQGKSSLTEQSTNLS